MGTVDYISTAPWNDPFNAFPQYAQVSLSGMVVDGDGTPRYANNEVLPMTYFNPLSTIKNTNVVCRFASADGIWQLDLSVVFFPYYDGNQWVLDCFDGDGAQFSYDTMSRSVPCKTLVGSDQGWQIISGSGIAGLLILPVTMALTPWEHRRRWALNG